MLHISPNFGGILPDFKTIPTIKLSETIINYILYSGVAVRGSGSVFQIHSSTPPEKRASGDINCLVLEPTCET